MAAEVGHMQGEQVLEVFLWVVGFILAVMLYVAVLLTADRAGKIVKLLQEIRDRLPGKDSPVQ